MGDEGPISPRAGASSASATRRYGSRSVPVDQYPPQSGMTVTAAGLAVSSSAAAVAATEAPSPIPTVAPLRRVPRSTSAASRPTIRRVRSSGPATVGASTWS